MHLTGLTANGTMPCGPRPFARHQKAHRTSIRRYHSDAKGVQHLHPICDLYEAEFRPPQICPCDAVQPMSRRLRMVWLGWHQAKSIKIHPGFGTTTDRRGHLGPLSLAI